jgi:hypothetical protein
MIHQNKADLIIENIRDNKKKAVSKGKYRLCEGGTTEAICLQ